MSYKAFLVARVNLSVPGFPHVDYVGTYSEEDPTTIGNYVQFVVESASGSTYEEALKNLGERLIDRPRFFEWVWPMMTEQDRKELGHTQPVQRSIYSEDDGDRLRTGKAIHALIERVQKLQDALYESAPYSWTPSDIPPPHNLNPPVIDIVTSDGLVFERVFVYEFNAKTHTHWRRHRKPKHPDQEAIERASFEVPMPMDRIRIIDKLVDTGAYFAKNPGPFRVVVTVESLPEAK